MAGKDIQEPEDRNGKIIEKDVEKEMKDAYMAYAMSVIVSRALPDVRDGLKPVHRRILYTMFEDGLTSDKPYRKFERGDAILEDGKTLRDYITS